MPAKHDPCITALAAFTAEALDGPFRPLAVARGGATLTSVYVSTGVKAPRMSEIERGLRMPTDAERGAIERHYGGRLVHIIVPVIVEDEGR